MRAVIVYESMFGNTHSIARAITKGLEPGNVVSLVSVAESRRELLEGADLIVAGGPTHVHGMSRLRTREAAVKQAHQAGGGLALEPGAAAGGPGLRDWFGSLGRFGAKGAAFDTRVDAPAMFTGRASKGIAKLLEQHGLTLLAPAESFLVTKGNQLSPGEEDRAQKWGEELGARLAAVSRGAEVW